MLFLVLHAKEVFAVAEKNVYDDETFFQGYQKLRENTASANELVEKPALFLLCPDFAGKAILDLGCGCGENCAAFSDRGANRVVGVDLSEKMLAVAAEHNSRKNVQFLRMSMNDIDCLQEQFDLVVSSLAFHYIEGFDDLLKKICTLLNEDGLLIFSQEHPLTTAHTGDDYWAKSPDGSVQHYNLTNYANQGERHVEWLGAGVVKYHRTFSQIINSLTHAGFEIEEMQEPIPSKEQMGKYPWTKKCVHKPDFLLIKARKKPNQPMVE